MPTRNIITEGTAVSPSEMNKRFAAVHVAGAGAHGIMGDGSTNDADAFNTLFYSTIDSDGGTVELVEGTYVIGSNLTVPSHITLKLRKAARLKPSNGVTLTITGMLEAPLSQIFDTSAGGTIKFATGAAVEVFPEWWGARADGSTDSDTALNAAISALPNSGGTITLSQGAYNLANTVTVSKAVHLRGNPRATTLRSNGTFNGVLVDVTAQYARISGMTVSGENVASDGVRVRNNRVWLSDLYIEATTGPGLSFVGVVGQTAHANKITDVYIINCGTYGLHISGSYAYDNQFVNVWIGQCNVGARIESQHSLFTNFHVWGNTGNGVEVRSAYNSMRGVYIESNGGNGVDIFNADACIVSSGYIWNNANHGVNVSSADRTIMSDLQVYDNGSNGINGIDSLYGQVRGCQFFNTGSAQNRPLVTSGTSDYWIVTGNVMRAADHATGGMSLAGSNNLVDSNVGYVDENSGTATVPNGATSVTVSHGLADTPSLDNISVTPTNNLGNATKFWISNPTATEFTINVDVDPGVSTATFAWHAVLI